MFTKEERVVLAATEKLNLPCPRLQLTWLNDSGDWLKRICIYTMVLPLANKYDIRAEDIEGNIGMHRETHAEICRTKVDGGRGYPMEDNKIQLPFRDGAHIAWDSKAWKLPGFVVLGDNFNKVEPRDIPEDSSWPKVSKKSLKVKKV